MFGFGMPELILIFVIMLVVFGPGKLPQLGSSLGGAIKSFKKASEEEPKEISTKKEGENEQGNKDAGKESDEVPSQKDKAFPD